MKMALLPQALGTDVEPTSARLAESLARSREAPAVAAAIDEQAEHFDMLGLQLGYIYEEGALVPEGSPPPLGVAARVRPDGTPGARLPHAWIDVERKPSIDPRPVSASKASRLFSFGEHERWAEADRG